MKYDISDKVICNTKDCNKGMSCLLSDDYALCEVVDCVNNKVHFIKCLDKKYCTYKMSFGNEFICNCPVRKELFNLYGI